MIFRGASKDLPTSYRHLGLGLVCITAVLALLAVASSLLAVRYQQRISDASRYNSAFDFSQTASELMRFQLALENVSRGGDPSELVLRHDILLNRLSVIADNDLADDEDRRLVTEHLQQALAEIEPLLDGRVPGAEAVQISARLKPLVAPILRLASRAHAEAGDAVLGNQTTLSSILATLSAVTLVLVAFGVALVGFVVYQNRRLVMIARTDPLTGLANRLAVNAAIRAADSKPSAMILVDVDHFKAINDTLGHKVGDRVVVEVADRLREAAQTADTIARIGGDEFAILFSGADARALSLSCADRILKVMTRPIHVEDRDLRTSVTLGLSAAPASEAAILLNDADIALYAAKAAGRGGSLSFKPAMKQAFLRARRIQDDLRRAIAGGELFLVYQPIVDLSDGSTCGFEALLRWRHPNLGLISPDEFIPIAERDGQIKALGAWVMEEACRQAACWPEALFVAVNVSTRQLLDRSFVDQVRAALAKGGLDPHRLEIEITESALIENDGVVLDILCQLKALGCRISLDDFGTGYASLSYLQRFPFDKIKIDQSFLRGETASAGGQAIIAMICSLAGILNLSIVTEGIETDEHLSTVRRAGSHYGQGYLFDRPLAASDVFKRLADEMPVGTLKSPEMLTAA